MAFRSENGPPLIVSMFPPKIDPVAGIVWLMMGRIMIELLDDVTNADPRLWTWTVTESAVNGGGCEDWSSWQIMVVMVTERGVHL